MLKSNCSRQVVKRQQIKKKTLVLGIDIGSAFNAVVFMNKEGNILGKYPKVYNSRGGFDFFVKAIDLAKQKHGFNKVLIGFEPTGHYWRKIAYFSKDQGYEVKFIRTTALKHQRALDESSSAKCDIKDAITIANIVREGKYIDTVISDDIYRQLRTLGKVRERILRYNTGNQNALRAVLDDYFPELTSAFWSMKSKGLWAILDECPFPEDVVKKGVSDLGDLIGRSSRRRKAAHVKALKLYRFAQESVGLKNIGVGDRYRLKMYLEELKRSEAQLKDIKKQMGCLLEEIPCSAQILSIKGIGVLSASIFLGELGNPINFRGYKQIVKYAGYDPVEKDSGNFIGRRHISKKGRYLLRKYLFFMTMQVIKNGNYFKKYYDKKLKKNNLYGQKLRKKEAMCAVTIKLIKVIFAVLRDGRNFTERIPKRELALVA